MRTDLLAAARNAASGAYAPYSKFRVGAAVVVETTAGPRIVTGVNVENASFGLALCAERNALAAACTLYTTPSQDENGKNYVQKPVITHVAVACIDAPANAPLAQRTPCGACRQWLAELAPNAVYYVDGIEQDLRIDDLLPLAFRLND